LQSGQPVSDPTICVNSLISAASKSIYLYPPPRAEATWNLNMAIAVSNPRFAVNIHALPFLLEQLLESLNLTI
jgi:hypothetical protein